MAWDQAQRLNTGDAFQNYLSEFPMGTHSQEAFTRMIRLSELGESAVSDEPTTQTNRRARGGLY